MRIISIDLKMLIFLGCKVFIRNSHVFSAYGATDLDRSIG